jgi:drug/metabolite transporter (DMT)-like permease
MNVKGKHVFLYSGVFLNTIIFATYYSVVKESLSHWGTLAFICCTIILAALPAGLLIGVFTYRAWSVPLLKWSVLLGGLYTCISIALSQALEYTSVTETAFFPCLNGILAALLARFIFGKSTGKTTSPITWLMALLAACGMVLLMISAPPSLNHWRGDAIAFLAGTVLYVLYVFLVEAFLQEVGNDKKKIWAMLSLQFLAMSVLAASILLLFGDWQAIHPVFPDDFWPLAYLGIGDVVLSNMISLCVQSSLDATTITFLGILEPILADVGATLLLGERCPWTGYVGASMGVLSVFGQMVLPHLVRLWQARRTTASLPTSFHDYTNVYTPLRENAPQWSPYLAWETHYSILISRTKSNSPLLVSLIDSSLSESMGLQAGERPQTARNHSLRREMRQKGRERTTCIIPVKSGRAKPSGMIGHVPRHHQSCSIF